MVFSISITPKRYLHDLFAGHKDTITKPVEDGKARLSQSGFKCDYNTLVATSPFTEYSDEIEIKTLSVYPSFFVSLSTPVYRSPHAFFELRGPPSLG